MMSTILASTWQGRPARALAALLLVAGTVMLAGCASTGDYLPHAMGGLPEGVPQRPAAAGPYPAVHVMPPSRTDVVLSDAEKKRLRDELATQRERAARETADAIGADPTGSNAASARTP